MMDIFQSGWNNQPVMKEKMITFVKLVRNNPGRVLLYAFAAAVIIFYITPVSQHRLRPGCSMRIFSKEGALLRQFNSDNDGGYSRWLPLNEFPQFIKEAVIASEDKRFYFHPGFDPVAAIRASAQNIASLEIVSGASTITQQAARIIYADILPQNILLKKGRSFWRINLIVQ